MKKLILGFSTLLILLNTSQLHAQQKQFGNVTGEIINEKGQPLPYATVKLLNASDSTLVKGALSDQDGKYQFNHIAFGSYFISVGMIGMQSKNSTFFSLKTSKKNLEPISLKPNQQVLKGVQVTAAKPFIQHKPGQTVVNVENSTVSAGNTVMEVLEKSPGVFVDQDDNISMNGKSGVNILINGRPTHLSSKQLAAMLKGMPASAVSRIELMTQPPAKYSAEGTAGLINIVLKKQTALGMNGNLTAGIGYGQYLKYNAGGSLNYRNKNFSLYTNYGFDHRKNKIDMDISRSFYAPASKDLQTIMQQTSTMKFLGNNHTGQLGMDFYLSKKQTIGFVANGSFNNGELNSYSPVYFMDPDKTTDSVSTSKNHTGYNWNNASGNLHYNLDLDEKGSAITANLDYNRFYQAMPQSLLTTVTDGNGGPLHNPKRRKGKQPNTINIYAAKVDYTGILKHNFKLEAGLKTSFVNTNNNSNFQIFHSGEWQNDPGNTNHFVYKENINAAYLSLSKTLKKGWSTKIGLRGEQTNTQAKQLTMDSTNSNHYLELFPNLALTKMINPNNILNLSYSRRIDRPSYQSLNPFIYYVDEYTYRVGNPYLKPQFVNTFELGYTFRKKYSAVLSYSHTSDIMSMVLRQVDSTHTTFQTQDNISKLDNLTLNLGIPVSITKWWQTYNSLMFFYNLYNGTYSGYELDKGYVSFMANTHQSFILGSGWTGELTGMFRSNFIMGPLVIQPLGMVSAGIKKALWNDKATLKLNVQDIFQTLNFRGKINFGNLHATTATHIHQRAANLTFTWNFGNRKVKVDKHKNSAIQKEENRIQKGNSEGNF